MSLDPYGNALPTVGRIDPSSVVTLLMEAYRGMGDGRREVDEAPVGMPPRNGTVGWHPPLTCPPELLPTKTLTQVCRDIVMEWKLRTGRLKPRAPARPERLKGIARHGHGKNVEPRESKLYRARPAGRPMASGFHFDGRN